MATLDSPVRHRLELLERTVYAIQAQQRVLEYRMQYLEENNALRGSVATEEAQLEVSNTENSSLPPLVQTPTPPADPSAHSVYGLDLHSLALDRECGFGKNVSSQMKSNGPSSTLIPLDEPLSTPIHTPPSKGPIPTKIGNLVNFPTLTPTSITRSESGLLPGNEKHFPTLAALQPLSDNFPGDTGAKDAIIGNTKSPAASEGKEQMAGVIPWDGTIAWKFIRLFKNKEEEKQAMTYSMGNSDLKLQDEWIFQYGLRYLPRGGDKDIYRTVRIEGLPEDITLDKVLAVVCYGDLFSADLLNTFPIAGYHTARVVFLHQQSAEKFCKHAKKGVMIKGVRARVTLERTATYPIGLSLSESISKHGCTRCVSISGITEPLLEYVEQLIAESYLKNSVETYFKEHTDMLDEETANIKICVRFHSMKAAMFACTTFRQDASLKDCIIKYVRDPCNRIPL